MNEYHYQSHYCIVAMKLILILVYFSNIFVHINAGDVRHLNGLKHWDNGLILSTEQHEGEISGMYTMKRIEGDIRGFYEGLLRMIEQKAGTADFTEGCPTYLTLQMHGMAAFFQSKHRAFTYHISGEKVNGRNYWLSGDEQDAIWYGPHQVGSGYGSGWHIGPTRNVGELLVGIYSKGNENCPNEASTWKYFDGNNNWISASANEINLFGQSVSNYNKETAAALERTWKDQMADYKETIIAAPKDSGEFWEIVEYYGTPQEEGYVEENFERWEFKEGLEFKDQDLGLGIICNRPDDKTLECNSVDNVIRLQNSYKFQTDGYTFTETELSSGKSYKIFMEKIHSIDHTSEPLTLPLRSSPSYNEHVGIDNHPMALPNTAASMQYSNSSENVKPFFASRMIYVLIACPLIIILMIFMVRM